MEKLSYAFEREPVDVGLAINGGSNVLGPLVFTALFVPSQRVMDILLRYDLYLGTNKQQSSKESISDVA